LGGQAGDLVANLARPGESITGSTYADGDRPELREAKQRLASKQ
jgi:hypothetical protein